MNNISDETKKILEAETLSNIDSFVDLAESIRRSVRMIDRAGQYMEASGIEIPKDNFYLKRISEYSMLLTLIWLDITAAFRVYFNAKKNYEVAYASKQLLIIINEGFKKIYGYLTFDKNGNLRTGERNKSFWIYDIGNLIHEKLLFLEKEYDFITLELDKYDDDDLKKMKDPRDLFVHYDKVPTKVYDELENIDIERITVKTIPFMRILSKMIPFTHTLLKEYALLNEKEKNDAFDSHHKKLEEFKKMHSNNPDVIKMLTDVQVGLLKFKNR
ncbi:hypothetical protein RYH73_11060 [Olivibacter sp. CPCC 100613]|uniref:hypothetical protein n=1 Tax=Olivibacter sp. CPCC 100613 TaxID=3079931 RepID=UPI002FF821D4